jgi:hypothetical protein
MIKSASSCVGPRDFFDLTSGGFLKSRLLPDIVSIHPINAFIFLFYIFRQNFI